VADILSSRFYSRQAGRQPDYARRGCVGAINCKARPEQAQALLQLRTWPEARDMLNNPHAYRASDISGGMDRKMPIGVFNSL